MENQKPAFFIFDSKINNMNTLLPYLKSVEATYKAFNGELLVQGGEVDVIEGSAPQGIIVILRFNCMTTARSWYSSEAYQAIVGHRHAGSQANGWLVEGLIPV